MSEALLLRFDNYRLKIIGYWLNVQLLWQHLHIAYKNWRIELLEIEREEQLRGVNDE